MNNKVKPGDTFLSSQMLNRQADAASALNDRIAGGASRGEIHQKYGSGYQPADSDIVLVRNDTGCDLSKFDAVGLDYLVNTEDMPTYGVSRPNACRHAGRFAVLTGEIKNGQVGYAAISGASSMYVPQMGNPSAIVSNLVYNTTSEPVMTVDAGFFGTASAMQRAHGLHKVAFAGAASVLHYDDIGSEYRDLAVVKLRNPSPELVEASRSRCRCADGSCTYKCQQSAGEYSWTLHRQDCDRADIKFTHQGWPVDRVTPDDSFLHTACSCDDSPITSRTCNASSDGEFLTIPCQVPTSTIRTILFADTDEFCGQYCLWNGSTLIRGCDESCNSECACVSPEDLGSMATEYTINGEPIPYLFRTPCLKIDEGGLCVHKASSNGWTEVYNNCSAKCPCEEPSAPASSFPAGYRYSQKCNRARCIPCSPAGACKWRYNEVSVKNGLFTQLYAKWTLIGSFCSAGCECASEPPGYEGQLLLSPQTRYTENEVLTVPCCKSPWGSPCDPTTTTTTTTIPPSTIPPCAGTCSWICRRTGTWPLTNTSWHLNGAICPPVGPYQCACNSRSQPDYRLCNNSTVGSTTTTSCSRSGFLAGLSAADPTTSTTSTTAAPTTGTPTVSPSTTEAITAAYPIVNSSGTTLQPTCRVICVKAQPTVSDAGTVYQSGYTGIEVGTADGLCSRYGNSACIIPVPCNESTAGQVIEGICRTVER